MWECSLLLPTRKMWRHCCLLTWQLHTQAAAQLLPAQKRHLHLLLRRLQRVPSRFLVGGQLHEPRATFAGAAEHVWCPSDSSDSEQDAVVDRGFGGPSGPRLAPNKLGPALSAAYPGVDERVLKQCFLRPVREMHLPARSVSSKSERVC
jgi:hypothetical protein